MSESLFDQLRARGEGFLTEISNNLMANPAFIEILKKGTAAKQEVDNRVAEGFLTEISNNLVAKPAFIEILKKGTAAKEEFDKRVAEGLKAMNVATRKELSKLEKRLAEMEAGLLYTSDA